jgi:hypothetical protein
MLLTIACMGVVCAITIIRLGETVVAVLCVTSICTGTCEYDLHENGHDECHTTNTLCVIGVLGNLHWWSVTLDPITMAFSIMAGGFAVDYAAHICYYYASCTDRQRATHVRLAETFHVRIFNN